MITPYTDRQLLLAMCRSLTQLDYEGLELDTLIYDVLNLAGMDTVAEEAAASKGFSDSVDTHLQFCGIKRIQDLITRH